MLTPTKTRPIKCRACGHLFTRLRPLQVACSLDCAQVVARQQREKAERLAMIEERKADRAKLRAMEPLGKLKRRAQDAANRYVKLRDHGLPCFDCGKPMSPDRYGGAVDAGHVRGIGQCPSLRFDLRNIMAERKECNAAGGATDDAKKAGALARLGPERYAAIDGPQPARKWTREWLQRYARIMNKKARRQAARLEVRA